MDILNNVGLYGPIILGVMSLFILRNKPTWFIIYIAGYIVNYLLNIILKLLFKQPRPDENLSVFYAKQNKGLIQYDRYGMPSGHAQTTLFSTVYIWFSTKNYWITLAYFFVSCLSIYHRLKYNHHDILQIIIGGVIGIIVACITAIYVKRLIPGILRAKPDDNGPI